MEQSEDGNEFSKKIENEEKLIITEKTSTKAKLMIFICLISIFTLSVIGIIIAFSIKREPENEEEKENNNDEYPKNHKKNYLRKIKRKKIKNCWD